MSLEIFVVNAVNLPNLESLGKIDPYLSAVFQGMFDIIKLHENLYI